MLVPVRQEIQELRERAGLENGQREARWDGDVIRVSKLVHGKSGTVVTPELLHALWEGEYSD